MERQNMNTTRISLLMLALLAASVAGANTITVTTPADSGPGSLRDALQVAADGDTINLSVSGVIPLTSGELYVGSSVAILGPGPGRKQAACAGLGAFLHELHAQDGKRIPTARVAELSAQAEQIRALLDCR
jgi:hypothetical protein